MTAKEFTQIVLVLPEAMKDFSSEQLSKLANPNFLREAFLNVLGVAGEEKDGEVEKFLIENNLEIVENVEEGTPLPVGQTRLIGFLENEEDWLGGEDMVKHARKKGAERGIRQAFYDKAHQDEIPEDERGFVRIYSGTILCHRGNDDCFVLSLDCPAGEWILRFHWLACDFRSRSRVVGRSCE